MSSLPTGTVTFLFTDIEGSTALWEKFPEAMKSAHARHDAILRTAVESHNGYIVKMRGDGIHAAFANASDALAAALAIQRALRDNSWGETGPLRVRSALHTGMVEERDGDYFGSPVNRAARLTAAGHGGQILISLATQMLLREHLPDGATLRDLGLRRLKDLIEPEHVFQVLSPDLPYDFPPLATLDNRPNNLPAQTTPLIGREKEIEFIETLLRRVDVRLATVTGPGGMGKTRVGLQVAADMLDEFQDGAYFVNLAPVHDANLVAPTIARTLGVREGGEQRLIENLKQHLRKKQILLLLDNFEQVVSAAPLVAELLAESAQLKIIVTSREVLHLRGEHEFLVPPLMVPDPNRLPSLEQLSEYAAVVLFIQGVRAVNPEFALTDRNAHAIAEICARLEGLPLAIELAAARCKVLSPEMILLRLSERFALLTTGTRDLPARHQTLRNAVSWSYELLNENEKTLFTRLSVFVSGCSLETAVAICNSQDLVECDVMNNLASLVDKSLVQRYDTNQEQPRFTMLETIREYAREKLIESGEDESIYSRHLEFFASLAKRAETHLHTSQQLSWLNLLELEHDNLRAALDFAAERKEWETGLQLAGALWWFWYVRGYLGEGRARLEQMLRADRPDTFEPPTNLAYAKALYGVAALAWRQGDYPNAAIWSAQSKVMCQLLGDQLGLAWSFYNQGLVAQFQSDYGQSAMLFEQSLAHFKQVNETHGIAMAMNGLGDIAYFQGDFDRAVGRFEESLRLVQKSGDSWGIAHTQSLLGVTQIRRGKVSEASDLLGNSLSLFRELGEKSGLAYTLDNLGSVAQLSGDYSRAIDLIEEGLGLRRDIGNLRGIAASLGHLGKVVSSSLSERDRRTSSPRPNRVEFV